MADEVLEIFIRQYIESQPPGEILFTWQGGEPTLMRIPFFEKVLALQKLYLTPTHTINNALQTNGYLLDDAWGKFLKENEFLVGLSMDGPPELHDMYRKNKTGGGTHAQTLIGLNILKNYNIETNILACVSTANVDYPLEVYRYFRDTLNIQYIQFIPIVERINKTGNQHGEKLSHRSITGKEYGNFLISIFDEWVQYDVSEMFVQIFETSVGVWLGMPASICVFAETCGACLALEHNGDLYACDHFVQPDALLGNISERTISTLASSPHQKTFGVNKKALLPAQCLRCDVRFVCNGGCPKNRILPPKNDTLPINHLCEGYHSFFRHIDKPMRLMASLLRMKRPAADISQFYSREN